MDIFSDSGLIIRSDDLAKATSPEKEQLLLRIERSAHPFAALGLSVSQLQADLSRTRGATSWESKGAPKWQGLLRIP